ncbi:alpha/beta hydrolase [Nocardia sp. CDC159]|uniref:Alpha/beta hydrolase n=1 Tax=Nocardia pulmonis TaxID=2951408 RepID=A0A9X2EGV1_9NOCA|nr:MULTISPECIES: alpha/beta hydrolase [Nocardia]MCM6777958.1 alpha/beta hydrolase [Nocardia pulmonis]MCM6790871.1 alpha/beta hydrolase [Nocardia sp. CDC159]
MDRYYHQRLAWGSCESFSGAEELDAHGFECTRVTVPIDYAEPDGETAQIAISRHRASGDRIGSLLTNPGGPGGPGLAGIPQLLAETPLAERFDVIGVDVRGLGASTPKVTCRTPEEHRAHREDPVWDRSPIGIAQTEKRFRDYVADCVRRTDPKLLAHIGTADVARDFDVIRGVLGDEKLTYFGGSYGSRLGSTIAETYPDRVRAMVLDAAIDPTATMLDPVAMATGFQNAFNAYAADCTRSPDCPLGTDPSRATAEFRALTIPLQNQPVPAADGKNLGYLGATGAVLNLLYQPSLWPVITKGLNQLRKGRGDALAGVTEFFESSVERDLQQAVLCGEEPRITDHVTATVLDLRTRAAAPITDDGRATGLTPLPVCAFWPFPPFSQPHVPNTAGLPKTVVVATTGDPATPYAGGRNLARYLDAALITYEGTQHGAAFRGTACVDEPLIRYLTDLTPPPAETTCSPS